VTPGDDLRVALPDVPQQAVVVDTNDRGETFFAIDDMLSTAAGSAAMAGGGAGAARLTSPRIGVAWDASFSRESADRERDLRLLSAHLARLRRADVDVVVFRNVPEPARSFAVVDGDASALVAWLRAQPCDGATNLAALRLPEDVGYTLLFTDGLSTMGGRRDRRASSPIYAVSGDPHADHARLRALAEESGGVYVNLQRHTDADALDRLGRPGLALLGVDVDAGDVADLEPAGVQAVAGGRVRITGRLLTAEARLTLRYGLPGSDRRSQQIRAIVIRRDTADDNRGPKPGVSQELAFARGSIAAHLWAQQRMATLARDPEANRVALVQLGQRFSLVTPGTSLLVLETLDQYVRHNVTPPASWPEMRAAFREQQQRDAQIARAKRGDKTEQVVAMWRRRVEWWTRSFPDAPLPEIAADARALPRPDAAGRIAAGPLPATEERDRQNAGQEAQRRVQAVAPMAPPAMRELPMASAQLADTAAKAESSTSIDAAPAGRIVVQPWNPDTPYLRSLQQATDADRYRRYLAERTTYGDGPAFFLDCANLFAERGQLPLALRILTTVAELRLEDARLMRVLAHRLSQVGELDLAVELFERVHALRPEEPQSFRDLALTLDTRASARAEAGGPTSADAIADARRALTLLADVVEREWDGRFPEVEVLALVEANRIATRLERVGVEARWPLDERLRRALDFDVRVVLTWDTDDTDMDLWVVEPTGERCFYSNPQTRIGGLLSRDFTGGYGPEEYSLRRAAGGAYAVRANFFGSRAQSLTGPTTVQATIITDYGRPTEARRSITIRLTSARDVVDIGAVDVTKREIERTSRK
jgi:Ca-activated chloride channel family protein